MKREEQWTKWEPIQGLSEHYYIESILDTMEGFKIVLSEAKNKEQKVHIIFENSVDSYQSSDETYRLKTFMTLSEQYGSNLHSKWSFFKIKNSKYLQWLSEESCTISDSRPLIHFSFFTYDSIIDVIASYEPRVELIEEK